MTNMLYILAAVIALIILYVLSTIGRHSQNRLSPFRGWSFAHRGLHGPGVPENSLKAFQAAKDAGYGAELDVHLLRDGNLAVIHDSKLLRCTGVEGVVEELTAQQLENYYLEGTQETIPTLESVLDIFSGSAPLIVELKSTRENYTQLCEKVCAVLDNYNGVYCLESFDPRCVFWLRRHRKDQIRGQLTENYFANPNSKLPWVLKFILTNQMFNFLTLPDFVAYRFADRKTVSNFLCRRIWRIPGVAWTLTTPEEYKQAVSEKWIPIFENFIP